MASGGVDVALDSAKEASYEPLENSALTVISRDGTKKLAPALSRGFMEIREFVTYRCLPSLFLPGSDVSSVDEQEWLERMSFFENDLIWLLKLPYHRFWSQVVYDERLQVALQSYLSHAPRPYDLNASANPTLLAQQRRVHKLVYRVFLRMSTYKETKEHHLSPDFFGHIVYDSFLFDLPRMLDLCVLYGFQNQPIIAKMINNCFSHQPNYFEDLSHATTAILMAFVAIEERLEIEHSGKNDASFPKDITKCALHRTSDIMFLDVVNYLMDTSATMSMFLEIFAPAGSVFYQEQAAVRIPFFYDSIIPLLEKELHHRQKTSESSRVLQTIQQKLMLSKSFLVKAFRSILASTCIQPILDLSCDSFVSSAETRDNHLESFIQIFTEIAAGKVFINDYNQMYPLQFDIEMFAQAGITIDPMRLNYVTSSLDLNGVKYETNMVPTDQNEEKFLKSAMYNGDSASSLQSIAASLATQNTSTNDCEYACAVGATPAKPSEVQISSLVTSVLDVFPKLGVGFVEACLDYYNYEIESVINAILTQNLPSSLDSLNRALKSQWRENQDVNHAKDESSSILRERKCIYDNDKFDIFNRDDVDMSKIHIGKSNKTPNNYENLKDDLSFMDIKALTLKYEEDIESKYDDEELIYDDEYDDTYDSHFVNCVEAQTENELLALRPFRTPNVLKKKGDRKQEDDEEEEYENEVENYQEEDESQVEKSADFCINPELLRQKAKQQSDAAAERKAKQGRGPRLESSNAGTSSTSNPSHSMKHKERHKGQIGNHNRRNQADYKRSRGMFS